MVRSNEEFCVCNVFATPHSKNPVKSSIPSYLDDNFNRIQKTIKTSESLDFPGFFLCLRLLKFSKKVVDFEA